MNLPNKLTVFRMLLTPLIIFFLVSEFFQNRFLISIFLFSIASITDKIDGFIARKYNQVTNFGKIADPLADKVLVIPILLCFIQFKVITAVPVIIIILREFLVVYVRLIAASQNKIVAANKWGKIKTASQIFAILFILSTLQINSTLLLPYCELVIWISTIFTFISGAVYVKDNFSLIKNEMT